MAPGPRGVIVPASLQAEERLTCPGKDRESLSCLPVTHYLFQQEDFPRASNSPLMQAEHLTFQ